MKKKKSHEKKYNCKCLKKKRQNEENGESMAFAKTKQKEQTKKIERKKDL